MITPVCPANEASAPRNSLSNNDLIEMNNGDDGNAGGAGGRGGAGSGSRSGSGSGGVASQAITLENIEEEAEGAKSRFI